MRTRSLSAAVAAGILALASVAAEAAAPDIRPLQIRQIVIAPAQVPPATDSKTDRRDGVPSPRSTSQRSKRKPARDLRSEWSPVVMFATTTHRTPAVVRPEH